MTSSNKWLKEFMGLQYFTECPNCKKCEMKFFCVDCCKGPLCKEERKTEHKSHRVLQVRKASRTFAVRVHDIISLVNIDHINQYVFNGAKIVFLPSRPNSGPCQDKPSSSVKPCQDKHSSSVKDGAQLHYYCTMCNRALTESAKFCSISCKMKSIVDGPSDMLSTRALPAGASNRSDYKHSSGNELPVTSGDNIVLIPKKNRSKRADGDSNYSDMHSSDKELSVTNGDNIAAVPERMDEKQRKHKRAKRMDSLSQCQLLEKKRKKRKHSHKSLLLDSDHRTHIPDSSRGMSREANERYFACRKKTMMMSQKSADIFFALRRTVLGPPNKTAEPILQELNP